MLNSRQRRFRKEMEKIQKEQAKQKEVYSYVHDEHLKGYFSSGTNSGGRTRLSLFAKFLRVTMYLLVGFILFVGAVGAFADGEPVLAAVVMALFISIVFFVFGLINPSIVIMGGRRTRGKALALYGVAIIVFLVLIVTMAPSDMATRQDIANETLPIVAARESREQFMSSTEQIEYMDLARNPDRNMDSRVVFTGKVIQTLESGRSVALRVNVNRGDYGIWQDTLFVNYKRAEGESRILENDIITLWGTTKGLKTYRTVLFSEVTIPAIDARYITIINNEK